MDNTFRYVTEALVETPQYIVTYYKAQKESNCLVITFNPIGIGLVRRGFATDFLTNRGFHHIHVSEEKNKCYQHLSIEQFRDAVRPIADQYDRVYMYGSSLGAYCALYFAGTINALPIALAPRCPALPYTKPFLKGGPRSRIKFVVRHLGLDSVPKTNKDPIVVYDSENRMDNAYVTEHVLPAYQNANIIKLPFAGHQIAERLQRANLLKGFVLDIVAGRRPAKLQIDQHLLPNFHIANFEAAFAAGDYDAAEIHIRAASAVAGERDENVIFASIRKLTNASGKPYLDMPHPSKYLIRHVISRYKTRNDDLSSELIRLARIFYDLNNFSAAASLVEVLRSAYGEKRENPNVAALIEKILHQKRIERPH